MDLLYKVRPRLKAFHHLFDSRKIIALVPVPITVGCHRLGQDEMEFTKQVAGCPWIRDKALSSETSPERCGSTAGFVIGFITAED